MFPAADEAVVAAERCERSNRLDCNRERVAWATAMGEALGADTPRAGELCKLPLADAAKDLCKPADMLQLGVQLGQMGGPTGALAGCLKAGEPVRTCHDRTLPWYSETLAKFGRELPVAIEPGFSGNADDAFMAQLLADVAKFYGHRCASISSFSLETREIRCNRGVSRYLLRNRSGVLVVTVSASN
ncbi:MAG: hypothetical protein F4Z19_18285 [Holophagales bacterium]|nr:hypothetical protein [Holophagales bacterium]